jgi:lipopolysaccharide export system permease protein
MKTFRRLIFGEIVNTVTFVTVGFLALFFFFDFVDEIQGIGKNNGAYKLEHALTFVATLVPSHLYELLPISGADWHDLCHGAFCAESSEFTILRTSGLAPAMALKNLLGLGLVFVLATFAVGDYLSPASDRFGQLLKSRYMGQITVGLTGAWLREKQDAMSFAVNVATLTPEGQPSGIRIFEFNKDGQWLALTKAKSGVVTNDTWELQGVERNELVRQGTEASLSRQYKDSEIWPTGITSEMISVALLKPDRMGTIDLFQYIRHLSAKRTNHATLRDRILEKCFIP